MQIRFEPIEEDDDDEKKNVDAHRTIGPIILFTEYKLNEIGPFSIHSIILSFPLFYYDSYSYLAFFPVSLTRERWI